MTEVIQPQRDSFQEDTERGMYDPIPLHAGEVEGWKEVPIEESGEPLAVLGAFSHEAGNIFTSSVYYGEHSSSPYILESNKLRGAFLSMFIRKKVAERVVEAEQLLPERHHLLVFDAYRSGLVQEALYRSYITELKVQMPDMTQGELNEETQKYVSIPSLDPFKRPSPHNTGGSIDLGIIKVDAESEERIQYIDDILRDEGIDIEQRIYLEMVKSAVFRQNSELLDFGTAFDHGGEKAGLAYFEQKLARGEALSPDELEACNNRRLLYSVMTKVGMQPYFAEWWHFNAPESQMGSKTAGNGVATYGAADFGMKHMAHEVFRQQVYKDVVEMQEKRMGLELCVGSSAVERFFLEIVEATGEPRLASKWPIEVIAPQFNA